MAVAKIPPPSVTLSLETQIRALELVVLSDPDAARVRLLQLRHAAQQEGDPASEAYALCLLGGCAYFQGENRVLAQYAREALTLAQGAGLRSLECRCWNALGLAAFRLGRPDTALEHYAASARLARDLEEPVSLARAQVNMAAVYGDLGDHEQALLLCRLSTEITGPAGAVHYLLEGRRGMIDALRHLGRAAEAAVLMPESLGLAEEYDLKRPIANLRLLEGLLHLDAGEVEPARESAKAGLKAAQAAQDTESTAQLRGLLGEVHLHAGEFTDAYRELSRSERLAQSIRHPGLEAAAKCRLARLFEAQDELDLARTYREAKSALLGALHGQGVKARALAVAAQLRAELADLPPS